MELYAVAILALVVTNFIQMRAFDALSKRVDELDRRVG